MAKQYDYSNAPEKDKEFLPAGYQGEVLRISNRWLEVIPKPTQKMNILEIGAYHGANICSLMKTYAIHPLSEVHCIDPWLDYNGYDEYKSEQASNYSIFLKNITKLKPEDLQKVYIHRAFSGDIIPTFQDKSFDMIYIDGNHTERYVLEDIVLSMKKIKQGGWIIMDDLQCEEVSNTIRSILHIYKNDCDLIQIHEGQLFIKMKK